MKIIRTLPSLESHVMEDFLDLGMEYRDQEPSSKKRHGSQSSGEYVREPYAEYQD